MMMRTWGSYYRRPGDVIKSSTVHPTKPPRLLIDLVEIDASANNLYPVGIYAEGYSHRDADLPENFRPPRNSESLKRMFAVKIQVIVGCDLIGSVVDMDVRHRCAFSFKLEHGGFDAQASARNNH